MRVTNDIVNVGVNDHQVDLFEGQYVVPRGMAYNSYLLKDEKTVVLDAVDANFGTEWLANIRAEIGDRPVDYLVVQHMEPDHSGSVGAFLTRYPQATVVASAQAFVLMKNFFGTDYAERRRIVKEGDVLSTGRHSLSFVAAPMVHWPEVMVTYDSTDGVLFSADAFGKFGANDVEDPEGWDCEARRYYIGIVGKYGVQVQSLLKKVSGLDVRTIYPLHGPALATSDEIAHALGQYGIWSSYAVESPGVCIAYTSVYGNTRLAVEKLKAMLLARGCPRVSVFDLSRDDVPEAVEDAFRYGKLVLATTTYNAGVFPAMRSFIENLTERNYQNRTVAFIENGSWAPTAAKGMKGMLANAKNLMFCTNVVTIRSALNAESTARLESLADELSK